MLRTSLLLLILLTLLGCRALDRKNTQPPTQAAPIIELPSFDRAEIIKVRAEAGYVVLKDLKMHAVGVQADVMRKGQVVGKVEVESSRRTPFLIARILSGQLQPGDTLAFTD